MNEDDESERLGCSGSGVAALRVHAVICFLAPNSSALQGNIQNTELFAGY